MALRFERHRLHMGVPAAADKLAVMLVPDINVAEVIVSAPAVFAHNYFIYPRLVREGDGFEFYHRMIFNIRRHRRL